MPIDFNTLNDQFRWRPRMEGAGRTKVYPEASGADFDENEPVIITTSAGVDYVTQIATMPSAGAESASIDDAALIVGFAKKAATGVAGTPIPVLLAQDIEVLVRLYNDTAASAEVQDVAAGDLAEPFRYLPTSGPAFMVLSAAPNGTDAKNKFVITERYNIDNSSVNSALRGEQAITDDYGLVWAAVRSTYLALAR
jgi:hypothetical protein